MPVHEAVWAFLWFCLFVLYLFFFPWEAGSCTIPVIFSSLEHFGFCPRRWTNFRRWLWDASFVKQEQKHLLYIDKCLLCFGEGHFPVSDFIKIVLGNRRGLPFCCVFLLCSCKKEFCLCLFPGEIIFKKPCKLVSSHLGSSWFWGFELVVVEGCLRLCCLHHFPVNFTLFCIISFSQESHWVWSSASFYCISQRPLST